MARRNVFILLVVFLFTAPFVFGQEEHAEGSTGGDLRYFAAALAVGVACIGGGMAVGRIGAAAMGAMSENPDLGGRALPFLGLAEGICLWGFIVALLILTG